MGEAELAVKPPSSKLPPPSPHFVLVHGIGGGAWCWYKIRTLMENSGFRVSCVELRSAGIDPTSPDSISCFDDYNRPLIDFMAALPETEQVILVGHSAGGLSLSQAMGKFAGKIRAAVFVAATMLRSGFWTYQDIEDGVPDLSRYGDVYELGFGLGPDKPPTSTIIKKEFQRSVLYQMSSLEDCTLAAMLLKPGPMLALQTARFTADSEDVIETVPRIYIRTKNDNVVTLEQQDAMIKRWPPAEVYTLDSDHSPFFSAPFLFFGLLVKVAAAFGYV